MSIILSILIIVCSILLIFLVFAQNPKGGGLSSDFGAATQLGGVQKTNDVVDKTTWTLAGVIAICSVVLTVYLTPKKIQQPQSQDKQQTESPAELPVKE